MLYGTVTEFCTPQEVSVIFSLLYTADFLSVSGYVCWSSVRTFDIIHFQFAHVIARFEYLWEDGVKYKRPTKLSAPEYVDTLMNWAQAILDDETMFPNKIGTTFARVLVWLELLKLSRRRSLSSKLPGYCKDNYETIVPNIRSPIQ